MRSHLARFACLRRQRLLLEGEKPVRLGSRAFDILAVLAENAGEVVPKEELIARVWPNDLCRGEQPQDPGFGAAPCGGRRPGWCSVHRHGAWSGVRVCRPGQAYRRAFGLDAAGHREAPRHNLPVAVTRMIGRDETVATADLSPVARATGDDRGARRGWEVNPGARRRRDDAVQHTKTASGSSTWRRSTDPRLVPSALATVLGLETHADDPLPSLVASLRDNRMLLVLDNCEHVIEAAAGLAATLLRSTRAISILATSREPLGVAGEREYRLRPLASPLPSPVLTMADARRSPRCSFSSSGSRTVIDDFALTDANAPLVVEICRRLGGLPLAIELAAARVEVLGIHGLAAHLDNSLQLLRARRRTTVPRHQTIRAVLDWSYGLLSEDEKLLFRRDRRFRQCVSTLKAAARIASDDVLTPGSDVVERLSDLVAKSLVIAYASTPPFHGSVWLKRSRAYALEKLRPCGEHKQLRAPSRRVCSRPP